MTFVIIKSVKDQQLEHDTYPHGKWVSMIVLQMGYHL
jgi:hypothetical protein